MASDMAHVLGRRTGAHFAGTCAAGSLTWFADHELRLAWRDWLGMMTAGRRGRERIVAIAVAIFLAFAHLLAWHFVGRYVDVGTEPDKAALVVITGTVLLSWSLLMSQAMESVTRAFYARSDLDLILSSPAAARKIFAVRIAAMALSVIVMAALLGAPLINVLIARGGARWLGAYGVVVAMGATAAAGAVALTVLAVPSDRAEAHAARRADRRRGDRGRVHHRPAGRRDPVARHAVAHGVSGIRHAGRAGAGGRQLRLVAGARGARRSHGACASCWAAASRCSPQRSSCSRRASAITRSRRRASPQVARGRRRAPVSAARPRGARAAAEGMDAARARSVARVADADADSLSAAASAAAVALLRRRHRRARRAGAGAGDGGGPTRRRARLARDFRRGRARSGGDRADSRAALSCARRSRPCSARIAIAFAPFIAALAFLSVPGRLGVCARHLRGRRCRDRDPVLLPQAGERGATSAIARPPRGLRRSPKRSRRSHGPRPPRSRWPARGLRSSQPRSGLASSRPRAG